MICKSQCFGDWEPIVHVLHIMQVLESQRERSSSRRSNQQLLNSLEHYCIEDNRGVDRQACWHTEFAWILFVASHKTCDIASIAIIGALPSGKTWTCPSVDKSSLPITWILPVWTNSEDIRAICLSCFWTLMHLMQVCQDIMHWIL